MERGQDPFPHLSCQHVMIRKLCSLPTQSPTQLKTQIASVTYYLCGHQLQLLLAVREIMWMWKVNFL